MTLLYISCNVGGIAIALHVLRTSELNNFKAMNLNVIKVMTMNRGDTMANSKPDQMKNEYQQSQKNLIKPSSKYHDYYADFPRFSILEGYRF